MDIESMCKEYYSQVQGYLVGLTGGDYDLAEELTQETFYQHIDKKKRHKEVSMDAAIDQAVTQRFEEILIDDEQKLELYKRIYALKSPTRDVMMFRLTGELSFQEIGEIFNKSENWARVTYYRGKQMIGKEMAKDERRKV